MPLKPSKTLIETVEIAKFVHKLAPKKVLSRFERSGDRAMALFPIIAGAQHGLTDREVMNLSGMDRRAYQKALSKLKAALLAAILELDLSRGTYSDYAQRLFQLDLAHARVRILERYSSAYVANSEAKVWCKEACALEEWAVAISLLSPQLSWAMLSGDKEEYERLRTERRRYVAIQSALEDAREAIERVTIVFAKSGAEHPELKPAIQDAISKLTPVVKEFGTFRLQESLLSLRKKELQVTMDYTEALAICDETERLLEEYPLFANRSRRSRNALTRLLCCVQLKQRDRAREIAATALDLFDPGDQNWYSFQCWRFILMQHTECYPESYPLVQSVMANSHFHGQPDVTRDLWNLFLIYAELFTNRPVPGEKRSAGEEAGDRARGLVRLFPSFKGDYEGYRMVTVVLEILINLERHGDRNWLIERIEALQEFKSRHLNADRPTQSKIFIDLMQMMVTCDFDYPTIVREAAPMLEEMLAIKTIDELQALQVQPYEMLWARAISALPL